MSFRQAILRVSELIGDTLIGAFIGTSETGNRLELFEDSGVGTIRGWSSVANETPATIQISAQGEVVITSSSDPVQRPNPASVFIGPTSNVAPLVNGAVQVFADLLCKHGLDVLAAATFHEYLDLCGSAAPATGLNPGDLRVAGVSDLTGQVTAAGDVTAASLTTAGAVTGGTASFAGGAATVAPSGAVKGASVTSTGKVTAGTTLVGQALQLAGGQTNTGQAWGTFSGTTDANGRLTIPHTLAGTPTCVQVTSKNKNRVLNVFSVDGTNIVVQVVDQTGTAVASGTSLGVYWLAIL